MFIISSGAPWRNSFSLLYVTKASYKYPLPQLKQFPVLLSVIFAVHILTSNP